MTQTLPQEADRRLQFHAIRAPERPRLTLFCFPHGGGSVRSFADWADLLPADLGLFAYAPPGRGERMFEPCETDLAAVATAAARRILKLAGAAPYALFGHSVGALLAFETACALERLGAAPPTVLGLSAHLPPKIAFRAERLAHIDDDGLFDEVKRLGGLPSFAAEEEELLRQLVLPPTRADFLMAEAYLNRIRSLDPPQRTNAPIALFAGKADHAAPLDQMDGWSAHSSNDCASHEFEGGHFYTETARDALVAALLNHALAPLRQ